MQLSNPRIAAVAFALLAAWTPAARAQQPVDVAAVVDGTAISVRDVEAPIAARLFALEQQAYQLRKSSLETIISRRLLENEARRRGTTAEALRSSLTQARAAVTAEAVEAGYAENAEALSAMSGDEARERVRLDLESQAKMKAYRDALAALRSKAAVEVRLAPPRLPAMKIDDSSPSRGPRQAPVVVTMFTDFQCPYCKAEQPLVQKLLAAFPEEVRLVVKQLPLEQHPFAMTAARGAVCAAQQQHFWEYHDNLFARDAVNASAPRDAARESGLDLARFDSCLNGEESRNAVLADVQEARRDGIAGTPTFVVNGRLLSSNSFEELQSAVADELSATHPSPQPSTSISAR